jgi:hypothetical protein
MEQKNNTTEIPRLAALALLDRGIAFRIPAPWLLVLFGRKTVKINVKRLYLGTLLHLSTLEGIAPLEPMELPADHKQLIADMEAEPRSLSIQAIIENAVPVCRAIAACLLNSRIKIALLSKPLGRYLRRSCTPDQLQELAMWLFVYGRPEAFTTTTKFLGKMSMTSSRN